MAKKVVEGQEEDDGQQQKKITEKKERQDQKDQKVLLQVCWLCTISGHENQVKNSVENPSKNLFLQEGK